VAPSRENLSECRGPFPARVEIKVTSTMELRNTFVLTVTSQKNELGCDARASHSLAAQAMRPRAQTGLDLCKGVGAIFSATRFKQRADV
jgi:hypothetical protein